MNTPQTATMHPGKHATLFQRRQEVVVVHRIDFETAPWVNREVSFHINV